jgi:xanthine/CO dehydrogenase XdhC/CoxF family maturation factor
VEEIPAILKLWKEIDEKSSAILATVVRVRGSAYRRPGARLLFTNDGRRAGSVSGGCLEGDLIKKSWWWTESGRRLVTYGTGSGEDGRFEFGLGCNGVVDILVERVGRSTCDGVRRLMEACRTRRHAGLIATVVEASGGMSGHAMSRLLLFPDGSSETDITCPDLVARLHDEAHRILAEKRSSSIQYSGANESVEVFLEFMAPPVRLAIFGAGFDAVPLAAFANELGWDVVVVDHRPVGTACNRLARSGAQVLQAADEDLYHINLDSDSIAVVMTHSYERDRALLRHLLRQPLRYLGILGPRERTRSLLAEFKADAGRNNSLYFPTGLDIGSDSPATTALAIVAEIQTVLAGRQGGMLRDRPGPIHEEARHVYRLHTAGV